MSTTHLARAVCSALGLLLWADSHAQQAPTPAESPTAMPAHVDANARLDFAAKLQSVKLPPPKETFRISLPSSDRKRRPTLEVIKALQFQANPATAPVVVRRAYTNYFFIHKQGGKPHPAVAGALPDGLSPQQMGAYYGFTKGGGVGAIAIVDAFRYPTAAKDLRTFTDRFGLQPCLEGKCLTILPDAATAKSIPINCGWNGEAALDLQWAYAIAGNSAKLIFVQANSDSWQDLYAAVAMARTAVKANGGGVISMSWSGSEYDGETADDSNFPNDVLYFAASGDVGGMLGYPAASPDVISVGGTGLLLDASGKIVAEQGWDGSGGGMSNYEPMPAYQVGVPNMNGSMRNIPDLAADAAPSSGAAMYVSTPPGQCTETSTPDDPYSPGWKVVGGTSLATPLVAAMTSVAGRNRIRVSDELQAIYANRSNPARVRDIVFMDGTAGPNATKVGYDNVTGLGSPVGPDFDAP